MPMLSVNPGSAAYWSSGHKQMTDLPQPRFSPLENEKQNKDFTERAESWRECGQKDENEMHTQREGRCRVAGTQ